MTISIEHTAAAMNGTIDQDTEALTNYEDALLEIARLREELWSKNSQIERLTETIVQMSIELANSKAKQDELSMQLRRASDVDITVSKPTVDEDRINPPSLLRRGSRSVATNWHSKSIAVQNPSARRKQPTDTRRSKSETWAMNGDFVEENGDDNISLEGELDNSYSSTAASTSSTNKSSGRGLGSLIRQFSGIKSNELNPGNKNPLPSTPELHSPDTEIEKFTVTTKSSSAPGQVRRVSNRQSHLIAVQNPSAQKRSPANDVPRLKSDSCALVKGSSNKDVSKEKTDSSALNSRRKPTQDRDINPGLKCSRIDFGSTDLIDALLEGNGHLSNGGNRNSTRQFDKKNAEWSAM